MEHSTMEMPGFLWQGTQCTFVKSKDTNISYDGINPSCLLRLDEEGMFVMWQFNNQKEVHVLECSNLREATTGIQAKDIKGTNEMMTQRILTIFHGHEISNLVVVQFVLKSNEEAKVWADNITKVSYELKYRHLSPLSIMRKQWKRIYLPINNKGLIPVRRLVKSFTSDRNEKVVLQKLKTCGLIYGKKDEISQSEFSFEFYQKLYNKMCSRGDVENIFHEISHNDIIDIDALVEWMNDNQRDPRHNEILVPAFDRKQAANIIQKFEPSQRNIKNNCLSLEGFTLYLASDENPLIYFDKISLHADMEQPLSHYFINSSHNTYLTGFQIRGKSSVDIYRHILLSGCRCIELDCWDGKGELHGEPIITHGKAMCTDVLFKNVLVAIRDAAFVTSQYPVILSFETHCSKPLQHKMAMYCREIFGEMLLDRNLESHPLLPGQPLPSPHQLQRKILIKNKRLQPDVEKAQLEDLKSDSVTWGDDDVTDETLEEAHPELQSTKSCDDTKLNISSQSCMSDISVESNIEKGLLKPLVATKSNDSTKKSSIRKPVDGDVEADLMLVYYAYQKTSATNIHPSLSVLVNYCQSVKFPGFKKVQAESEKCCFHMSSFSENGGMNYIKSNAVNLTNYNKSQLSRIYPRGNRVDSSNYMPQIFWNVGCQLVSLNYQTSDLGMQLNLAKFEYNAACGYLLKPEALRQENKSFDCFAESTIDGVIAAQCGVKIISGQFVSTTSSFVEVDMYGLPNDTIRKEFRTSIVANNGLNTIYKSNEFLFRKVIYPDLAMLRFTLYDDGRQLIGQRVVPLNSLQTGYRYVPLRSPGGVPLDSTTLFVKINLKSYVPDNLLGELRDEDSVAMNGSCCLFQFLRGYHGNEEHNEQRFDKIEGECGTVKRRALVSALDAIHKEAIESMKQNHKTEMTELTSDQTKQWMAHSKQFNKNKQIPSAERERRVRELKSQSVKKFTDQRLKLSNKHGKQLEKLELDQKEVSTRINQQIDKLV
nr:1-phosphatidylinositol 4,5-bisphosphate phosphodiesterase beta-4 [Ciona intestinalis]|eukprot:XP_026693914.1 1-phosphatidylinositol 4,5-bisphosphate phosphodiesterase beta-4 [Ciona intestinalis]